MFLLLKFTSNTEVMAVKRMSFVLIKRLERQRYEKKYCKRFSIAGGSTNLLFGQIFPQNCMKMK